MRQSFEKLTDLLTGSKPKADVEKPFLLNANSEDTVFDDDQVIFKDKILSYSEGAYIWPRRNYVMLSISKTAIVESSLDGKDLIVMNALNLSFGVTPHRNSFVLTLKSCDDKKNSIFRQYKSTKWLT